MSYLGDFTEDSTVNFFITTNNSSGGTVAPSTAFEAADIIIYKDNSAAQKTSTNGVTMTSPFDTTTGLHQVSIDTSNDTGDSNFWQVGHDYYAVLAPDETVDSQTIVCVVAHWSIENRNIKADVTKLLGTAWLTPAVAGTPDVNAKQVGGNGQTAGDLAALLATLTAYVDTEVAAIKAKTDNLSSDPADASDIAAAFSTVNGTLSTIAGYIDTEVAAIKAKTDALPTDPADASDIAASFSTISSTLATIATYIDTEVAAIKAKTDQLTFTIANKVDSTPNYPGKITGSVNDAAATATSFIGDSGLSATDDLYNGGWLVPTSGTLKGIPRRISDYTGATRTFTFNTAFPAALANGVTFDILGRAE